MSGEKKLKKEFTTSWSQETVFAQVNKMTITQARFFEDNTNGHPSTCVAIIPDNIPFSELMGFAGHKTKVTIEIVPW